MATRRPEALPRPTVVAHLVANVERLTEAGVFARQLAARTVFLHLCCHPDGGPHVPHADKRPSWTCPVAAPHYKPADIAKATGLTPRGVRDALDWLAAEGLIDIVRGTGKRPSYGLVTIRATDRTSDYKWRYGTQFPMHRLSPAQGTQFPNREPSSLNEVPATPGRPRRTVAGRRVTSTNGYDFSPSGNLEGAAGGARTPSPEPPAKPSECEARVGVGPGIPTHTQATSDHDAGGFLSGVIAADVIVARQGKVPVPDVDADVDRVMALLGDLPGWGTDVVCAS